MSSLHLIEEFLNTLDERTFSRHGHDHEPGDRLTSPQVLADWLAGHGLAVERELGPEDLRATTDVRTALRRALVGDSGATPVLDDYPLRLAPAPAGGMRLVARSGRPWLDVIVETVAQSAARDDWRRIKLCAAPDCRWAFYDTSRNGRGRWCEMEICGNRHKTRAYRERQRETGRAIPS